MRKNTRSEGAHRIASDAISTASSLHFDDDDDTADEQSLPFQRSRLQSPSRAAATAQSQANGKSSQQKLNSILKKVLQEAEADAATEAAASPHAGPISKEFFLTRDLFDLVYNNSNNDATMQWQQQQSRILRANFVKQLLYSSGSGCLRVLSSKKYAMDFGRRESSLWITRISATNDFSSECILETKKSALKKRAGAKWIRLSIQVSKRGCPRTLSIQTSQHPSANYKTVLQDFEFDLRPVPEAAMASSIAQSILFPHSALQNYVKLIFSGQQSSQELSHRIENLNLSVEMHMERNWSANASEEEEEVEEQLPATPQPAAKQQKQSTQQKQAKQQKSQKSQQGARVLESKVYASPEAYVTSPPQQSTISARSTRSNQRSERDNEDDISIFTERTDSVTMSLAFDDDDRSSVPAASRLGAGKQTSKTSPGRKVRSLLFQQLIEDEERKRKEKEDEQLLKAQQEAKQRAEAEHRRFLREQQELERQQLLEELQKRVRKEDLQEIKTPEHPRLSQQQQRQKDAVEEAQGERSMDQMLALLLEIKQQHPEIQLFENESFNKISDQQQLADLLRVALTTQSQEPGSSSNTSSPAAVIEAKPKVTSPSTQVPIVSSVKKVNKPEQPQQQAELKRQPSVYETLLPAPAQKQQVASLSSTASASSLPTVISLQDLSSIKFETSSLLGAPSAPLIISTKASPYKENTAQQAVSAKDVSVKIAVPTSPDRPIAPPVIIPISLAPQVSRRSLPSTSRRAQPTEVEEPSAPAETAPQSNLGLQLSAVFDKLKEQERLKQQLESQRQTEEQQAKPSPAKLRPAPKPKASNQSNDVLRILEGIDSHLEAEQKEVEEATPSSAEPETQEPKPAEEEKSKEKEEAVEEDVEVAPQTPSPIQVIPLHRKLLKEHMPVRTLVFSEIAPLEPVSAPFVTSVPAPASVPAATAAVAEEPVKEEQQVVEEVIIDDMDSSLTMSPIRDDGNDSAVPGSATAASNPATVPLRISNLKAMTPKRLPFSVASAPSIVPPVLTQAVPVQQVSFLPAAVPVPQEQPKEEEQKHRSVASLVTVFEEVTLAHVPEVPARPITPTVQPVQEEQIVVNKEEVAQEPEKPSAEVLPQTQPAEAVKVVSQPSSPPFVSQEQLIATIPSRPASPPSALVQEEASAKEESVREKTVEPALAQKEVEAPAQEPLPTVPEVPVKEAQVVIEEPKPVEVIREVSPAPPVEIVVEAPKEAEVEVVVAAAEKPKEVQPQPQPQLQPQPSLQQQQQQTAQIAQQIEKQKQAVLERTRKQREKYVASVARSLKRDPIILRKMQLGSRFRKTQYHGAEYKTGMRTLKLDPNATQLIMKSDGLFSQTRRIPVSTIRWVVPFNRNKRLHSEKKRVNLTAMTQNLWRCFMIVCANRTYDFEALDDDTCLTWIQGLQQLVYSRTLKEHRPVYSKAQLLFWRLRLKLQQKQAASGQRIKDTVNKALEFTQKQKNRVTTVNNGKLVPGVSMTTANGKQPNATSQTWDPAKARRYSRNAAESIAAVPVAPAPAPVPAPANVRTNSTQQPAPTKADDQRFFEILNTAVADADKLITKPVTAASTTTASATSESAPVRQRMLVAA